MRIQLSNPPVNEVILTVYFDPVLKDFKNEHVGLFWSSIASEFPRVEQKMPLSIANGQDDSFGSADEFFPMPRYWFVSRDSSEVIQVHKQAFTYNWRNVRETTYPGFHERVKPAFDAHSDAFARFLRENTPGAAPVVGRCELTYVNVITQCEYWSGPVDTANVVPSFSVIKDLGNTSADIDFNHTYRYQYSSENQLQIAIRSAKQRPTLDNTALILQFEIAGNTLGQTIDDTFVWFKDAHEEITRRFIGLTDPDVRKIHWGSNE